MGKPTKSARDQIITAPTVYCLTALTLMVLSLLTVLRSHCISDNGSLFSNVWGGKASEGGLTFSAFWESTSNTNQGIVGARFMARIQWTKSIMVYNSKNVLTQRNINRIAIIYSKFLSISPLHTCTKVLFGDIVIKFDRDFSSLFAVVSLYF